MPAFSTLHCSCSERSLSCTDPNDADAAYVILAKEPPADVTGDLARLHQPHITTIYSTEAAEGVRFLAMELVEGQSLDALIPPTGAPLARKAIDPARHQARRAANERGRSCQRGLIGPSVTWRYDACPPL
jgi:hypothetical protein